MQKSWSIPAVQEKLTSPACGPAVNAANVIKQSAHNFPAQPAVQVQHPYLSARASGALSDLKQIFLQPFGSTPDGYGRC